MGLVVVATAEDLDVVCRVVVWIQVDVVSMEAFCGLADGAGGEFIAIPCDGTA